MRLPPRWMTRTRLVFFVFGCLEQGLVLSGEPTSLAPISSGAHTDPGYQADLHTSGCGTWRPRTHSLVPASQKAFSMAGPTPGCSLKQTLASYPLG